MKQLLVLSFCIITWFNFAQANAAETTFQLKPGDLLFQDLNCGEFCDNVDSVTTGYANSYVSHVALVIQVKPQPLVIEAVSRGVVTTPLQQFLDRSLDQYQRPRVMVGRLQQAYQVLIPPAIAIAEAQLGKPYNVTFVPAGGRAFYCSELITYAFNHANLPHAPLFKQYPMNFHQAQQLLPTWSKYYHELGQPVPQGVLGSNPGALSRESAVQIIYAYGQLRTHN